MSPLLFYKSLKQSDLTALSALETIHNILNISELTALKRYTLILLECSELKQKQLQQQLPKQFYFLNPIKEQLETHITCSNTQFLIQISYKNPYSQHPLHDKICRSFNLETLTCTESKIWKISCVNTESLKHVQSCLQNQESSLFQLLANPVLHDLHLIKQS